MRTFVQYWARRWRVQIKRNRRDLEFRCLVTGALYLVVGTLAQLAWVLAQIPR